MKTSAVSALRLARTESVTLVETGGNSTSEHICYRLQFHGIKLCECVGDYVDADVNVTCAISPDVIA